MPLIQSSIRVLGKVLPKILSPKAHAIADYGTAGIFLLGALLFWRHSKRAAVASLICGAAETTVAALTDHPGGLKKAISFPLHRKIELGLSSMAATMPEFLAFGEEKEKAFFHVQSAVIAGLTVLTDFESRHLAGEREIAA
ncbi:MAG TPA: hypothetical protein VL240_01095 [Candidatus Binatia bacterium]|nr:hypothetical protein [Candidatus Binatia bacterium]